MLPPPLLQLDMIARRLRPHPADRELSLRRLLCGYFAKCETVTCPPNLLRLSNATAAATAADTVAVTEIGQNLP